MTDIHARTPVEDRTERRDEVYARARATLADRRSISMTVVNVSPNGLMARCDAAVAVGEWIKVDLPVVGTLAAAVRWSLGGRIGCQLDRPIDARPYHAMLTALGG